MTKKMRIWIAFAGVLALVTASIYILSAIAGVRINGEMLYGNAAGLIVAGVFAIMGTVFALIVFIIVIVLKWIERGK